MYNNDFDPYQELLEAQSDILEHSVAINNLINAHNKTNATVVNLANQNAELARLITQQSNLIAMLKADIEKLQE